MSTPSQPTAHLLLIGDELLAGELADRNGPHFAVALGAEGFAVVRLEILPDEVAVITRAVSAARSAADLVLVCGGLGPTSDDRTTEAVAAAAGVDLRLHEAQWARIQQAFQALRGTPPPPGNEKQATIPVGAEPLLNAHGTALGYALPPAEGNGAVAVMPGPPKENQPMWADQLLPMVDRWFPERPRAATHVYRVFGLAESSVGHALKGVEADFPGIRVGYQFHFPEILVKLRVPAAAGAEAEAAGRAVEAALAPHLYGRGEADLPAVLGRTLAAQERRIVTAESCTGGLCAKLLTDTAGSSAWFERGFVTYTNEAKREVLRVPGGLLAEHGAVSEPVALAMLEGALERSAADVGLAITGISGPGGGSGDKPVGTVCIAWGDRRGQEVKTYQFRWDRAYNRLISAWTAFGRVLQLVRGAG